MARVPCRDKFLSGVSSYSNQGREVFVYFNNDPEAHAIHSALRLRELLGSLAVPPT